MQSRLTTFAQTKNQLHELSMRVAEIYFAPGFEFRIFNDKIFNDKLSELIELYDQTVRTKKVYSTIAQELRPHICMAIAFDGTRVTELNTDQTREAIDDQHGTVSIFISPPQDDPSHLTIYTRFGLQIEKWHSSEAVLVSLTTRDIRDSPDLAAYPSKTFSVIPLRVSLIGLSASPAAAGLPLTLPVSMQKGSIDVQIKAVPIWELRRVYLYLLGLRLEKNKLRECLGGHAS